MQGTFQSNSRGCGFVTVEGLERDLFIPPDKTGSAFYMDTVEVRLLPTFDGNIIPDGKDGRRQEAEVVKIIERGTKQIVGTFQKTGRQMTVEPDNRKIPSDIFINRQDSMGAVSGHKVVVEITEYGSPNRGPEGKVVEILGHMDDPGVDILSIIRAYNLPGEFPDEVKKQVKKIPDHITPDPNKTMPRPEDQTDKEAPKAAHAREDWRDVITVTIDGPDTKDIDDAISIEKTESGWRLGVHIADVAQYVQETTPLGKEALARATSIYLVDRVIPMLPHELSNGICSLNEGEDRFALSCIMDLNKAGDVTQSRVVETIIRSDAKLSYPGVMRLFTEKDDSEIVQALERQGITRGIKTKTLNIVRSLRRARKLAAVLQKKRAERGSIDFDFPESKILLDENGRPTDIVAYEANEATTLIENFMVLANETVASTFYWLELPFVYRTHGEPTEEKIERLRELIGGYGYQLQGKEVHPKQLQELLHKLKGRPEENLLSVMTLRSMQRAEYTPECGGHFGMALKYYCHFTSPIRRYPDLQIHRIIKDYLHGKMDEKRRAHYDSILPSVCKQSSLMERRADEAERETDKQKKAEYMQERVGGHFEGVISGVTGWGIYVELPNTIEGLVRISDMRDDYYTFDEERYLLYGERSGRTFTLGQKVDVICAAADTVARTIDFVLEDATDDTSDAPRGEVRDGGAGRKAKSGDRKKSGDKRKKRRRK